MENIKMIRIPDSEFKERVVKVQAKMAEENYDMLLCYGNEAEPQFVRYFTAPPGRALPGSLRSGKRVGPWGGSGQR